MRLYELAYCCRLYEQFTGYDMHLTRVRKATDGAVDLLDFSHRDAVLSWLREWGCRQFALKYQQLSSDSLRDWASAWMEQLPSPDMHLVETTPEQRETVSAAYADLRVRPASWATSASGSYEKTFGPVGAAKTLYILRPNMFPPWDNPIIKKLGYGWGGAQDFMRYLTDVASQLRAVSRDSGLPVKELPAKVGRPHSSPPKLIDEYNWVVVTKGCRPPTPEELRTWSTWAG